MNKDIKVEKWSERSKKFRKSWFKSKVEVGGAIQKPKKVEEPKEESKQKPKEIGEKTEPV